MVGLVVQRGEGVVKDEDFRVARHCAGNGQTLLLPAGEVRAALRDRAGIPDLRGFDKFRRLRDGNRLADGSARRVVLAVADVAADRAGEQERLLRHKADLAAQGVLRVVTHVHAVYQHLPACCVI